MGLNKTKSYLVPHNLWFHLKCLEGYQNGVSRWSGVGMRAIVE